MISGIWALILKLNLLNILNKAKTNLTYYYILKQSYIYKKKFIA